MKVDVIYENGVLRPVDKINLSENQKLTIHLWPKNKDHGGLEKAYSEASRSRTDLEEWETLDREGWE